MSSPSENPLQNLSFDQLLQLAVNLHQQGHLTEAEEVYRKLREAAPQHPDINHFLGVLWFQLGRREDAVKLVTAAVEAAPTYGDAHNNLGNMLVELGRLDEAAETYRRAAEIQPTNPDVPNNLGVIHKRRGDLSAAEADFRRAVAMRPEHPDALENLSHVLERQGRLAEATEVSRRALRMKQRNSHVYENLARTLRKTGRIEEAAGIIRQWLEFEPRHPVAQHMLAALSGEDVPHQCSDAYVQTHFNHFAADFDAVLAQLEYAGPAAIGRLLEQHAHPADSLTILDAGCGTGLCGPVLAPLAARLVGVDLSEQMLAQARRGGLYDELVEQELTSYLEATTESFDVIAAADTLIYIGELQPLLRAAASRIATGGWLLFTVEDCSVDSPHGYRLESTGRFSHSQAYLADQLPAAGFTLTTAEPFAIRKECDQPVAGHAVAARPE